MSAPSHFERIDPTYLVEEETMKGYDPKHYYPVYIGEVLRERYVVVGKLGFGSTSTVWLCRDLHEQHEYVTLKVYINNIKYHREVPIYEEINNLQTIHDGRKYVRKMYNSFELQGPHGMHICLIHQPLGISLGELKELTPDGSLSALLTRQTLRCILAGFQFLHKEVRVIHTGMLCYVSSDICDSRSQSEAKDLQPSNMLLGIPDDSVLAEFEKHEMKNPCPRKELDDRTIYLSRPMLLTKGEPSITDLSEARFGDSKHTDTIMPNVYRAPEVILGLSWSYPVDIWGFAMVCGRVGVDDGYVKWQLWDLFQPRRLFQPGDSKGRYSEAHHLAEMIALMGPPPPDFLRQCGEKADQYWEKDGQYGEMNHSDIGRELCPSDSDIGTWKDLTPIPDTTLELMDQRLEGEEKQQFVAFMRKMLQWDPKDRQDSEGVYWDEWLLADLIESGEVVRED